MKPYQCRNRLFWRFCLRALSKENSGEIKSDVSLPLGFRGTATSQRGRSLKILLADLWGRALSLWACRCPSASDPSGQQLPSQCGAPCPPSSRLRGSACLIHVCTFGPPQELTFRKPTSRESSTPQQTHASSKAGHNGKGNSGLWEKPGGFFITATAGNFR